MKKLMSVLLVFAMLLTGCLMFTSCNEVSAKEMRKDPYTAINDAVSNTASDFFADNAGVGKVLSRAAKSGSFDILFEVEGGLLGKLSRVNETIYVDQKGNRVVSDTAVTYEGTDYTARIYGDKDGVAVNSQSLLGTDATYALRYETAAAKFKDSAVIELLKIPQEAVAEISEILTKYAEQKKSGEDDVQKQIKVFANKLYETFDQTIVEDSVEGADGKSTKCVKVEYSLNNDKLKAALEQAVDELAASYVDAETLKELKASVTEAITELDKTTAISVKVDMYISQKTNKLVKLTFTGDVKPIEQGVETFDAVSMSATAVFSDTEISFSIEGKEGTEPDDSFKAALKLTKEQADENVTYKLSVSGGQGAVSVDLLNLSVTHANSGELKIDADVSSMMGEDGGDVAGERFKVSLVGSLTATKEQAKLEFTKLTYGDATVNFKLAITATAGVEVPALPEGTKDLMELTKDEWQKLVTDVTTSPLMKLIGKLD